MSDSEDDTFNYEDSCDVCVKGWDKPNEFGRCECQCSCGVLQRVCKYRCQEEERLDTKHLHWFHNALLAKRRHRGICLYDHPERVACGVLSKALKDSHFKSMRELLRSGDVIVRRKWVRTVVGPSDKPWYVFVMECLTELWPVSMLGFVLGMPVPGLVYAFETKQNRDAIVDWLNK